MKVPCLFAKAAQIGVSARVARLPFDVIQALVQWSVAECRVKYLFRSPH
jgi:hypothetical protein